MSGQGQTWTNNVNSGDSVIDGILLTNKWTGSSITYYFPATNADYQAGYFVRASDDDGLSAPLDAFQAIQASQTAAIDFGLSTAFGPNASDAFSVAGFTNLDVNYDEDGGNANLRFANSDDPGTAYAFGPGGYDEAGDVWLGDNYDGTVNSLKTPVAGNYAWLTILHEIGHALGLDHSHEDVIVPIFYDRIEYTIMSYRAYQNAPITGYTFEQWGAAQTFMMYDIAALQHMYGADYTANTGNTVYKWAPSSGNTLVNGAIGIEPGGNRIFATIWDGNGVDTYDLSAYTTGLNIDLAPGGFSSFSAAQKASLGAGNFAQGNIYNALLYQGNLGSLIENAIGGSATDVIGGNQGNNALFGNASYDVLSGYNGNDWLSAGADGGAMTGGAGADWFVILTTTQANFAVDYNQSQGDVVYIAQADSILNWTLSGDDLVIGSSVIINTGNSDIRLIWNSSGSLIGQNYSAIMGSLLTNGLSSVASAISTAYSSVFVDADNSSSWFVRYLYYNASNQLESDGLIFDDKSFQLTRFDLNPASGTDQTIFKYNTLAQLISTELFYSDGSRKLTLLDADNTETYTQVVILYNTSGQQTRSDAIYDDGTKKTTFFDPTNAAVWTYVIQDRNASDVLTRTDQINDNGTRVVTVYDAANAQDYTNVIFTYNAAAQVTKSDIIYDDGTRKTTIYDPANTESYSTVVQTFNAAGQRTTTDATYDDGTRIVTVFDPTNAFNYDYATYSYNGASNLTAVTLNLDNGGRKETLFDATNSELYSIKVSDFNASDQLTKLTTYNDTGTRFETAYDQGSAAWLFSTKVFDTANLLDSVYTKNDNGTATFVDYDQTNSFTWSYRYVTFDASGNILTDDYIV